MIKKISSILLLTVVGIALLAIHGRRAGAQLVVDSKTFSGGSAKINSCVFANGGPIPVFRGNIVGIPQSQHGATDHCEFQWSISRDHLLTMPLSVTIYAMQNGTGPSGWNYGHISCFLNMVETPTTSVGAPVDIGGTTSTLQYSPTRPSGTPVTFNLAFPTLLHEPDGSLGTFNGGAMSVLCDFGNDFLVTGIGLAEQGTD
jgi:hypothetical protein